MSDLQRCAVLDEARKWLGARWQHAARVPYQTCDCAHLVLDVLVATGVVADFTVAKYPSQWAIHNDYEWMLAQVRQHAVPITTPMPADVVLFKGVRVYHHVGFIEDWPMIIHADRGEGVVRADASMGRLAELDRLFFTVFKGD